MKRLRPILAAALAGCGRLDELLYEPPTTPREWCERRPCHAVGNLVLNEPVGTILVFLLAFLWIAVGGHFLHTRCGQRSRLWLGIALVLGGAGAAQAGVSYQAFSYVLKCAGREYCRLTTGFEVGYGVTQAAGVSAMLVAVAHACVDGGLRRVLVGYALVNAVVYAAAACVGVMLPSRTLLSFEVLLLFALPGLLLVILAAAPGRQGTNAATSRGLRRAAVLLLLVQAAYYAYAAAGLTVRLWQDGQGVYLSENEVLHAGMILWLAYVAAVLGPDLRDFDAPPRPRPAESA